ncbi:diguanylate cyclase (GGDEF)-like protein [Nitrosospira sp. Nsp2]|uniref:GGDEF domain-containing protein n=1 Tax=Nitrosospira sp. Nsp2 TaxID=136548 RepID=UPI000D31CF84|nr:GGDEF domain-containing protein [Nitrosospira sp. Nsp2]PTR17688.1 diguanylate cyclase (GGDEF)-like protein [Nitrosospira sp. Nsp2]
MNNIITPDHGSSLTPADTPASLEKALEKSEDVKEKMVDCVTELATVNEAVKQEMATGITLRQAKKALAQSESVEEKVQECADELHEVNQVLAEGIGDRNEINRELKKMGRKLAATQHMLSHAQDVLAVAEEAAEQASQRTLRDFVTGIPNRELFNDRLEQAIALAQRGGWILGVMFIDLDRFKAINDTHGHAVGDRVLQAVAQRLDEQVRSGDTICRWGGDEFLYLLVNPQSAGNIEGVARKVLDRISEILIIDDLTLSIEPSIGIAVYPSNGRTSQELLVNADAAMYRAKKMKTGFNFFDDVQQDGG